ncbi:hypothetical protein Pmani_003692 [Petrolisthes manimaculis]|uniref:Uncharacterized protein n=1 Tax=Petrolisthes manimaculis TaxID=1843537 RepID=A0AAE1QF72_9EUCA|nr:hypothetical protein Pmani_003692 [Petrolisthes manimaculis]
MKANGNCLVECSERMKACMEYSCVKGAFTRRKVPSIYQVFAAAKSFNWCGDEYNKWRRGPTVISACKKSSGIASIFKSKLRSVGCFGRMPCRLLLATRIIADCVGSEGQGAPTVTCLCTASVTKAEPAVNWCELTMVTNATVVNKERSNRAEKRDLKKLSFRLQTENSKSSVSTSNDNILKTINDPDLAENEENLLDIHSCLDNQETRVFQGENAKQIEELKEKVKVLEEENCRLKEENVHLKETVAKFVESEVCERVQNILKPFFSATQIKMLITKKKVNEWTNDDIASALTLRNLDFDVEENEVNVDEEQDYVLSSKCMEKAASNVIEEEALFYIGRFDGVKDEAGLSPSEISAELGLYISTVYRLLKRWEEEDYLSD